MKSKRIFSLGVVFLFIVGLHSFIMAETTAIKAGKLVDVEKGVSLENQVILIENSKIKAM